MSASSRHFSSSSGSGYSTLTPISVIVFVLIVFVPILAAVEDVWAQSFFILAGGSVALLFMIQGLRSGRLHGTFSGFFMPAAVFFATLLLTILPLPLFLIKWFSPAAYAICRDFGSYTNTGLTLWHFGTLSLLPYNTLLAGGVLFSYAVVFYYLVTYCNDSAVKRDLARLLVIMAVIIAIWGLASMHYQNKKLFWFRDVVSGIPTGPFVNSIHFAHFIALCVPIVLGLWISRITVRGTIVSGLSALIMVIALFKALSRGAVVALCASIMILALLLLIKKKLALKALLVTAISVLVLIIAVKMGDTEMKSRILTLKNPVATESAHIRFSIWKDTVRVFLDFPLFGTGLNTFEGIFPKYKTIFGSGKQLFTHPENDYIETMSEVGLLGVVPILMIAWIAITSIARNFKKEQDPVRLGVVAGSISAIAAVLVGAGTDYVFRIPAIGLTAVCIVFLGMPDDQPKVVNVSTVGRRRMLAAVAALIVLLILFSAKVGIGQACFYKSLDMSRGFEVRSKWLASAMLFDGANPDYPYQMGKMCFEEGKKVKNKSVEYISKARACFGKTLALDRFNWRGYFDYGSADIILAASGVKNISDNEIEWYFARALDLNPTDYNLNDYCVNYYLSQDPEKGMSYFKRMVVLRPYVFEAVLSKVWALNGNPDFARKAVPDDPEYLLKYAEFLHSKGRPFERSADQYLIDAIKHTRVYRQNTDAFSIPSQSIEELVKQSDAMTGYAESALKKDPAILSKAALFNYQVKDYNKSAEYYEMLSRLCPRRADVQYKHALALYQAGRYGEAFLVFRAVTRTLINEKNDVYQ